MAEKSLNVNLINGELAWTKYKRRLLGGLNAIVWIVALGLFFYFENNPTEYDQYTGTNERWQLVWLAAFAISLILTVAMVVLRQTQKRQENELLVALQTQKIEQGLKRADRKPKPRAEVTVESKPEHKRNDLEEFLALEQLKEQEQELRQLMIYCGRPGLWDDWQSFQVKARQQREAEHRQQLKDKLAKKAKTDKLIETVLLTFWISVLAMVVIGCVIGAVYLTLEYQ